MKKSQTFKKYKSIQDFQYASTYGGIFANMTVVMVFNCLTSAQIPFCRHFEFIYFTRIFLKYFSCLKNDKIKRENGLRFNFGIHFFFQFARSSPLKKSYAFES